MSEQLFSPETTPHQLHYQATDYEAVANYNAANPDTEAHPYWYAVEVLDGGPDLRIFKGCSAPIDYSIQPPAYSQEAQVAIDSAIDISLAEDRFGDVLQLAEAQLADPSPVQTALHNFGYRLIDHTTSPDREEVSITYPTLDAINKVQDALRARTGFALRVEPFEGLTFNAQELGEMLDRGSYPISTDPGMELHDMVAHLPAWLLLPEPVIKEIASRLVGPPDPNSKMSEADQKGDFVSYLDATIDEALLTKVSRYLSPQQNSNTTHALTNLAQELCDIVHYDAPVSAQDLDAMRQQAQAMAARTQVVASLNQS